jgi:hypothetical protein
MRRDKDGKSGEFVVFEGYEDSELKIRGGVRGRGQRC